MSPNTPAEVDYSYRSLTTRFGTVPVDSVLNLGLLYTLDALARDPSRQATDISHNHRQLRRAAAGTVSPSAAGITFVADFDHVKPSRRVGHRPGRAEAARRSRQPPGNDPGGRRRRPVPKLVMCGRTDTKRTGIARYAVGSPFGSLATVAREPNLL
jgi:hypothetical protein